MVSKANNLLDMMTPEEQKKMLDRFKERTGQKEDSDGVKVNPQIYLVAEFGYYYGWQGIQAVREDKLSFDEMFALLEGARKVWYKKITEQNHIITTAIASALAKKGEGQKIYREGMSKIIQRGKIDGE